MTRIVSHYREAIDWYDRYLGPSSKPRARTGRAIQRSRTVSRGQPNGEYRSAPSFVGCGNRTAVEVHEVVADRKPQPESAVLARH